MLNVANNIKGVTQLCMLVLICSVFIINQASDTFSIKIHPGHIPFVSNHHPELFDNETRKRFKDYCWGYETDCDSKTKYFKSPKNCPSTRLENYFIDRVDFGYIKQQRQEIMMLCDGKNSMDSSLKCSKFTRFCIGKNIFFNFHALLTTANHNKFREDLFNAGDIGGFCEVNQTLLKEQSEHKSPLQSWYAELQNFSSLSFKPLVETKLCDIIFNHTVVFMKLDFGGNMFHHFCDFFNLYVSQHVNGSWFGDDIHIVMWDTATSDYFDPFSVSWKAFSRHPVTSLMELKGKRVCAKDVMFPLLPRMRYGMYYNTYVPDPCLGSNLFRAFSEHFLYRMDITQEGPLVKNNKAKVRVTLLQRGNPSKEYVFRQIRNQKLLLEELKKLENIHLTVVEYDWREMPFEDQLRTTHNSDVFIGMHGAGLAHFMFLPDWAVAVELYHCGDTQCYNDLARLRGLHYMTWPASAPEPVPYDKGKHYRYGENPKFWNWEFDPETFVSLVRQAADKVRESVQFRQAVKKKLLPSNVKTEL